MNIFHHFDRPNYYSTEQIQSNIKPKSIKETKVESKE